MLYKVYVRDWWIETADPAWPNGLEPGPGVESVLTTTFDKDVAREICANWNNTHDRGRLDRRAEWGPAHK